MPITLTCFFCRLPFAVPPSRTAVFCSRSCQKSDGIQRRATPLTHARLLEVVSYDPQTGIFLWRGSGGGGGKREAGERAGWQHHKGYRWVELDGKPFQEHRLAWFYVTGSWPADQIDHRDLCKSNNAIGNLRLSSGSGNQRNTRAKRTSKTGIKGVWQVGDRFTARIHAEHRQRHLGYFDTASEAAAAYAAAAGALHGEFARTE